MSKNKFSKRIQAIDASGVRRMFEMAQQIDNPLDMSLGMPDLSIPQEIQMQAIYNIQQDKPGYSVTAGDPEVRSVVVTKLQQRNQIDATVDEVMITSGATGGLVVSLFSILDSDDEIIIIDPFFVLYRQIIDFIGARAISVSSYPDWRLPIDRIKQAITDKTKVILINTPNNPTGVVYSEAELKELATVAKEHNLVVVSDEIYEEYVYDDRLHVSIGSFYPKTITIMGPSKTTALAGWRIGYLHAPADYIQQMIKAQQVFYVCASVPAQKALHAALNFDCSDLRREFQKRRDLVKRVLSAKYDLYGLEGSFYAFFPVGKDEEYIQRLLKESVLLVPGSTVSYKSSHVRLAYCVNEQVLRKGLDIIAQIG